MSKSVVAAYNAYPLTNENKYNNEINAKRLGFQQGYEQAEKEYKNQWISVEEALPTLDEKYDFSERYIVRTQNNEIKVMRIFRNIAWCDIYRGGAYIPFEKDIVTHWMPIPSLKGGEK